jgi:hypothetical protein
MIDSENVYFGVIRLAFGVEFETFGLIARGLIMAKARESCSKRSCSGCLSRTPLRR